MSDLYKVHILSSDIRTCFFYLNNLDLEYYERNGCSVKIQYGEGYHNFSYGCISLTPASELPDKCIGVTSLYANRLGLKEHEVVLLTRCDVDSISNLEILPKKEEDYVILLSCKSLLEYHLLNQVSVVAEGQVLPLYVFSNIHIDVEIGKLSVPSGYGCLEKFTEITVLHPTEKQRVSDPTDVSTNVMDEFKKGKENFASHIFGQLRQVLRNKINFNQSSEQKQGEIFIKHLVDESFLNVAEYKIQPSFLFPDCTENQITNKCIIVSNFQTSLKSFGPHCVKILANVKKSLKETNEDDNEKKEELSLNTYVISFNNNNENNVAFCPQIIMKKLNLFVGSKIFIKQIKPNPKVEILKWLEKINYDDEVREQFWERITTMREDIKQTIINNFKYNYKINTLIIGGPGTGKTTLIDDIAKEFTHEFICCIKIHCKALRGKKIETLNKLWGETLRKCAVREPSVLFLDDLHVLTSIDEEEGRYNRLYSERVVDLLTDILENFQVMYNISVIASSINMSELSSFLTQHGPRLFQKILAIPEMNISERKFALESVLNRKVSKDCLIDVDTLAGATNGYTIQDLNDLVHKAIFNSILRNERKEKLNQSDFDSALSEWAPANLKSVKLKKNIDVKWENVGGMIEPKKILTEVFSWPLKYPSILESCPLRIQRGVLLYGAPGTGKTLLAAALANKCDLNFISVKGPEVLSKYVGTSEEGVRNLFIQAGKIQPSLLFFDEFDSLAPKRGHDNTGVTDRVVNQLLTQLDGVESLNGVWVLAATSRPDLLDPALLRPGRLDKMVFCDIPNEVDRYSILEVLSKSLSKAEDVDLSEIARNSEGYTGADLQAVLYNSQMLAIKEEKSCLEKKSTVRINQTHLLKALSEVHPSLSQTEKAKYSRIYDKFLNSRKMNFEETYKGMQRITFA